MTGPAAMHTVVLLSANFPPSTLAGVHRARHMAKHLPAFGWRPIVLTADPSTYVEANDPALAELVPASVETVRTRALPAIPGVSDIGLRAYPYLRAALDRIVAEHRPAAIFITGFPFYPTMLAGRIKARYGLPLVLDFQDPWVSAHFANSPALSKTGVAHRLSVLLEPRAIRHADWITSVSDIQNDEMATRYPFLDRTRMSAIPIGGDPEDFTALRERPPASPQVILEAGPVHLNYVGAFLPRAGPLARTLFRGLARLRAERPGMTEGLRLNFIGTSNQPSGAGGERVMGIAREEGVEALVFEHPPRVPFLDALSLLANASALMMIGSDEPHYTASKIYPGLMAGRPYLSLFHRASSAHAILSAAGGGVNLAFADAAELAALESPIAAALARLIGDPQSFAAPDPAAYAPYTAQAVSGQFAEIFDRLTGR